MDRSRYPIRPLTYGQLRSASRPQSAEQPEAFADVIFDIQEYVDNTTLQLNFFRDVQADSTLGNLEQAGQLQAGNYFAIEYICFDAYPEAGWASTAAGGIAGTANDLGLLLYLSRPTFQLNMNQKPYGPWPMLAAGGLGGVDAFGWGTFTAEESIQYGQVKRGGFYVGGSIVIPPLTAFNVRANWGAVADLTDDYLIRCSLVGTRYREVA